MAFNKIYTISGAADMHSNGFVIPQPFTVEVHSVSNYNDGTSDIYEVIVCVKSQGRECEWDELATQGFGNSRKQYSGSRDISETSTTSLTNTLFVDLETAAGQGNVS
jgi:hypothetical protein